MMMLSIHKLYVLVRAVNQFCVLLYLLVCLKNEMYVFWTIQFLIRNNEYKISHIKGSQRTTPDGSGALTSKYCTRVLCLSPVLFLFLWLSSATPFKWYILWFISDWNPCYFCACHKSKMNFIPQPHTWTKKW